MRVILAHDPCAVNRPQACSKYIPIFMKKHNHTPLHDAAVVNHALCVKFLLESGSDPNIICPLKKYSPLEETMHISYPHKPPIEVAELLLRAGASPNNTWNTELPRTDLLMKMIDSNRNECARILLQYGADIESITTGEVPQEYDCHSKFVSPLDSAVRELNAHAMLLLFLHGSDFKFRKGFYNPLGNEMQSVPHFMLFLILRYIEEPILFDKKNTSLQLMIEDATSAIYIYYICGGDMWTKARDPLGTPDLPQENILELFKRRPELENMLEPLTSKMRELMTRGPMRMRELCRVTIQERLRRKFFTSVNDLGLPKTLVQYLQFQV